MERISNSSLAGEIKEELGGFNFSSIPFELLHEYVKHNVIPLILQRACTVAVVELTTCGMISDLLTTESGASKYFLGGVIPYDNALKIKLGFPEKELSYGGYGVVSPQAAEVLAIGIQSYTGADIGIAETGLITSSGLKRRKTQKTAGDVFCSIRSINKHSTRKLEVKSDQSRREMRIEIAFRVLQQLRIFLLD